MFVISFEKYAFVARTSLDQSIDGFARPRSAINVVAQENLYRSTVLVSREIFIDLRKAFVQQIQAAMDVTDGVNPNAFWQRRIPSTASLDELVLKGNLHGVFPITALVPVTARTRARAFEY